MKLMWMTHKGKRYLFCNYANFGRNIEALRAEVDYADSEIEKELGNDALLLVDLRNTVTSSEVVSLFKESAARTKGS